MAKFQFQDVCYPNEVEALTAFKSEFEFTLSASPSATVPYSWSLTSATITPAGLITYALKRSAGTTTLTAQTHQLQPCSDIANMAIFDKLAVQDLLFAGFFILMFVKGFGQGRGSN